MTPFFIFLLITSSFSTSLSIQINSDIAAQKSALITLRSIAIGGRTHLWDINQATPCNWDGITCKGGHVTSIRLPGSSLYGPLPFGIFKNLTHLTALSLRFNALSGPLPEDLGFCVEMRNLYLQGNNFSGTIPDFLFNMKYILAINLSDNSFSGEIPTEFNKLKRLRTLHLNGNQLSGSLPELNLPHLEQFNVSYNMLSGPIPDTLRYLPASAFRGNALCGSPLKTCPEILPLNIVGASSNRNVKKKKEFGVGVIVCIVVGLLFVLFMFLLVIFLLCRRKDMRPVDVMKENVDTGVQNGKVTGLLRNGGGGVMSGRHSVATAAAAALTLSGKFEANTIGRGSGGGGSSDGSKRLVFFGDFTRAFDLEDLLKASAEVLGKGSFGTTFKAAMDNGVMIVVKKLKNVVSNEREFREKIELVGSMDNENILPLRAYRHSRDENLLVYDYMPMGSLYTLLHGNKGSEKTPLSWSIRSSIALAAARGIAYLHSQGPTISHGNIKSSNILLNKSYEARVSDFGLGHLVSPSSLPSQVSGYLAPEVTDPRKVSKKADVYSFGILLFELLTGKSPSAMLTEEGVDIPRWIQSIFREEWTHEVFDAELLKYQNAEEQMVLLLQLAIDCSAQYPDHRPSMYEVVDRIDEILFSSSQYFDSVQNADDSG